MEGSEPGVVVPSVLEAETWVKLCNLPAEFLTADDICLIVSSFGSVVGTDEDTYEKMENHHRPPKLRRKLHSHITFVTIFVRVSVTKPLPSRVAVGSKNGREFIIRLDFDPTPKVCLLCHGAGHFDFECCGIVKESVESLVDDDVAVEDVLGVDVQPAACCDCMCDEVDGEQGAVTIDGVESFEVSPVGEAVITDGVDFFEDATVVEAMKFPAATCDVGDAIVGELEAVHSIVGDFFEQPLVERTAAGLEVQPLLPAPIAADGSEGAFVSDGFVCSEAPPLVEVVLEVSPLCSPPASCESGAAILGDLEAVQVVDEQLSGVFHKWRDFADVQGLFEDDSGPGIGLLGFVLQEFDCLSGIRDFIGGLHGSVIIDRAECHVFSPGVEADLAVIFHYIEQVLSVVNSPIKHHIWRDKSDVQGLFCCSYGLGPFGLDEDHSGDCKAPTGVISSIMHYLWCDILDEQGLSPFEVLDLLQFLSRLVWNSAATIHDLLFFKIHHKWRDKGC